MTIKQKYLWFPLLTGLIATIIGGAISNGLFQLWPSFWIFIGFVIYLAVPTTLGLYVHNLFYHATFLWIKYRYQRIQGNQVGAIKTLLSFAQVRPNDSFPWKEQVSILAGQKEYQNAFDAINSAISLDGETLELLELKISLIWEWLEAQDNWQQDFDEWRQSWEELALTIKKAIVLEPNRIGFHYDLAAVHLYLKRYRQGTGELTKLIENLIDRVKTLETERRFGVARRELWTVVHVQQKSIEIFENTLVNFKMEKDISVPSQVLSKIEFVGMATQKLTFLDTETINLYFQLLDLYVVIGKYKRGIALLKSLVTLLTNQARKSERKSDYADCRERLWAIVNVQQKEIDLLRAMLFKHRDEQNKLALS